MRSIKTLALTVISAILLTSCASIPENLKKELVIGDHLNARNYNSIYFSSQPTTKDLNKLANQGFKTIINLRHTDEYNELEEKETSKKLGLKYINIPFPKDLILKNSYIEKVTKAVMKNKKGGKLLIHCSSGNRAAIWAGGHFYKDHGLNKKESYKMALKLGLTKDKAKKKLNIYFERN